MKKLVLIFLILSIIACGCTTNEEDQKQPDDIKTYSTSESKEDFSIWLPDWEEAESDDPNNNLTLSNKQCNIAVNVIDLPPEFYEKAVEDYIIENNGTILSRSPLTYTLTSGKYTFKTQTKALFCDDKTYFVYISCLEDQFDETMSQEVFDSMDCTKEWETPNRENKKLGLVVFPQNTSDINSYYKAFNLARDNNVQMTHYYVTWGEVENNWTTNDFILGMVKNKGLKSSIVFNVIHTSVIGELPDDVEFKGWDDPVFISRFSDFVIEYIERYEDTVDYVEIGNEVDIYLNKHPDELDDYAIFYKEVYDNIKEAHPDMKVGTVFAYHDLKANNNFEVYETLSPIGDFDAFTLYIYSQGFIFDRDPVELYEHLQEIEELTGDRNFAIEEIGWNAYEGLEGNEEDQRQAVSYAFDYLEEAPDRFEFMNWFILYDSSEEESRKVAESFIEPDDPLLENERFMVPFSNFIRYLGLIESDGTPRDGWFEFTKRAQEYNEE